MGTSIRLLDAQRFDATELAQRRGSTTVSVCLPARNEERTVGAVVDAIRTLLVEKVHLVDELIVIDDHSTDATARVASDAGATVFDASTVLADHGHAHGKGEALWKSLHVSTGDLVAWCDTDILGFDPQFVVGLLGPLVEDESVAFTKGFYERTERDGVGGGRVTELTARPLLQLLFPDLASVVQPLSGEYAGRRDVLERLPFTVGYGVDLGLLIDVRRLVGPEAMVQVDLGQRDHRNRTLVELGPQALAVLQTGLERAGVDVAAEAPLPPLADVAEYRSRALRAR
jgi:glucosyl-3-phosphoglycerate synthase